jgi:hypothetical protein
MSEKNTASRAGNSEFGGWTKAGFRRFTALVCKHVEMDRKSVRREGMEEILLIHMKETPVGRKIHEKLEMLANRRLNGNVSDDESDDGDVYMDPL